MSLLISSVVCSDFVTFFLAVRRGDLGRCAEIVRWAANNGVPLPKRHNIQMINLVVSQKMNTPLALVKEETEEKPKYDFKF